MFPFIFEWEWDIAHLVFMGAAGFAVSIIGAGITYCILKTIYDTATEDGGEKGHH
ncbi:MAG: hypothetical protein K9J79_00720 [Desulfobacteraceae bacterium]|nr:hypothetical protein [Desulfobacteraceae bacterium]MCF8093861.1 hypothetical protein [Desulfobacteraceae bacterium]